MPNYCKSCGNPIPEYQEFCSTCYGDPFYGNDNYYQEWLEQQAYIYEQKELAKAEYIENLIEEDWETNISEPDIID